MKPLSMRINNLLKGGISSSIETQLLELNPNSRVFFSVDTPYLQSLEDYSIEELQNAIDRKRNVIISEINNLLQLGAVKAGISQQELLRRLDIEIRE